MTQPFRLPSGGNIDRARPLAFRYDGVAFQGYTGDTLASALLANGVHLVARSFKYHRPRGIFSAGAEEPNALVQLARGARSEPNVRATTQELYDGLIASSQNCWPSVRFDIGAINNAMSRLIPAGFYYKTFMWPPTPKWWLKYEHAIRHAAGMGRAASEPDPDHYEHRYAHCDVLVIGGGVAGLTSASAAAHAGARVIVCDENAWWGGGVFDAEIDGQPAQRLDRREGQAINRASRRHTAIAHDRVRLLRRQSRRCRRASYRSSRCSAGAYAAPTLMEDSCEIGRARQWRDRKADRVCKQRLARHLVVGRRAHLRQALRRATGLARGGLYQQRWRVCRCVGVARSGRSDRGHRRRTAIDVLQRCAVAANTCCGACRARRFGDRQSARRATRRRS